MANDKPIKEQKSLITKKDGGKPYLRILSAKTRTAQKCIQELKTCKQKINQVKHKFAVKLQDMPRVRI